jgi:hypothetical protein
VQKIGSHQKHNPSKRGGEESKEQNISDISPISSLITSNKGVKSKQPQKSKNNNEDMSSFLDPNSISNIIAPTPGSKFTLQQPPQ